MDFRENRDRDIGRRWTFPALAEVAETSICIEAVEKVKFPCRKYRSEANRPDSSFLIQLSQKLANLQHLSKSSHSPRAPHELRTTWVQSILGDISTVGMTQPALFTIWKMSAKYR